MSSPNLKNREEKTSRWTKEDRRKEKVRVPQDADLVRLKGFEPPTFWFVAKHSIQLSYSRISA